MQRPHAIWKLTQAYNAIPAEATIYQVCDHLLSAMERMGMLPPERKVRIPIQPKQADNGLDYEEMTFFSWEPEPNEVPPLDGPTDNDMDGINFDPGRWV